MFSSTYDPAQAMWDSESRDSPYCTVAGQSDEEDYCEVCDQDVDYAPEHGPHGACGCP